MRLPAIVVDPCIPFINSLYLGLCLTELLQDREVKAPWCLKEHIELF